MGTLIRKAYCAAARGRPAVVISADFAIYLGNESDQEASYTPSELCGFNTGTFEQKAVAGLDLKMFQTLQTKMAAMTQYVFFDFLQQAWAKQSLTACASGLPLTSI